MFGCHTIVSFVLSRYANQQLLLTVSLMFFWTHKRGSRTHSHGSSQKFNRAILEELEVGKVQKSFFSGICDFFCSNLEHVHLSVHCHPRRTEVKMQSCACDVAIRVAFVRSSLPHRSPLV